MPSSSLHAVLGVLEPTTSAKHIHTHVHTRHIQIPYCRLSALAHGGCHSAARFQTNLDFAKAAAAAAAAAARTSKDSGVSATPTVFLRKLLEAVLAIFSMDSEAWGRAKERGGEVRLRLGLCLHPHHAPSPWKAL